MAEKKKKCPPVGAPAWMCTFADMMSLLLCFFVLLLSFASMDQVKFEKVAGSLEKAFGTQRDRPLLGSPSGPDIITQQFPGQPIDLTLHVRIIETLSQEIKNGLVEVDEDKEGMTLRVKESVAFDSGRAELKPQFLALLDKLGQVVAKLDADVVVSGHTDNTPLKKDAGYASNWGLSTARAVNVIEYWEKKYRIPASRMEAVGYADGHPLAGNDTPEGRARNRRVEFRIRGREGGQVPFFEGISPRRLQNE